MPIGPRYRRPSVGAIAFVSTAICFSISLAALPDAESSLAKPTRIEEARARARLLHETIHGTLQVMHRDFFDEENAVAIPSASLEDVFHELDKSYDVQVKWLVVDSDIVNVDHQPADDLERKAAATLKAGASYFDQADGERYVFAGPIRLGGTCLKCHVKRRSDNTDRVAGLYITMPLSSPAAD